MYVASFWIIISKIESYSPEGSLKDLNDQISLYCFDIYVFILLFKYV